VILVAYLVVTAGRGLVIYSFRQGILNQEIYEELLADIDARLLRLESGELEKTIEEPQSAKKVD
jgi:hypothetical protein